MAEITMREAISQALWEEMERDQRVFIQGEEVGVWGGTYAVTKGFLDHFGSDRVRDTPIAEAAIVGSAIGISIGLAANEVLKSLTDGVIMPMLSVFIKRGELENKIICLGHAKLRVGELISNMIYFILVLLIILFILKFVMGGLINKIIENKIAMNKQGIQYERESADHLAAIRNYNVPL